MAYLALVRHGESEWNAKGLWTGWKDISLTERGREEARQAGEIIKNIKFDIAYVSKLVRAKETLDEIKTQLKDNNFPIIEDNALNERDYGDLTGKNKWMVKKEYGVKQWRNWRRGWDYPVPGGETLKDVYERIAPYYKNYILDDIKKGKNVLISAHGNSLRALVKYLENISDKKIPTLEIPTGQVYLYQINQSGQIISKEIRTPKPQKLLHHYLRKVVSCFTDHGRTF